MDNALIPYQSEQEYSDSDTSSSRKYSISNSDNNKKAVKDTAYDRTDNTNWCLCDNCI